MNENNPADGRFKTNQMLQEEASLLLISTSDWMMMCSNTTSGKSQALAQTEWSTQCPLTPALSQDPEAPIGNTRESIIDYFRTWKPPPLLWHSEKQKKIQRAQEWTRLIWGCCGCGRISRIDVSPIIQTNLSITADCWLLGGMFYWQGRPSLSSTFS